jgi:hypothetical protein
MTENMRALEVWINAKITASADLDHGALNGLADDDHTQYYTEARHDANLHTDYLKTDATRTWTGVLRTSGALSGLGIDNTGTGYLRVLSQSGNQMQFAWMESPDTSSTLLSVFSASGTTDKHNVKFSDDIEVSGIADFNGTLDVTGATITGLNHDALAGLADDDHTQYYNAARHTAAVHDALAMDHGALSGKADDDHTQYLRVDGTRDATGTQTWGAGFGIAVEMTAGDGGELLLRGSAADLFDLYWTSGPNDGSRSTLRLFGNDTDILDLDLLDGDLDITLGDLNLGSAGDINMGHDILWSGATKPRIVMDSTGAGDNWTAQGAHIVMGEQAANGDTAAAAVHITYNGGGIGHIGMGALDSTGKPAYGLKWLYTKAQTFAINDGTEALPFWTYDSDRDTGRYRKGANEMADATAATDRWLIGTYGVKISTSLDILPRSDNSSQLGASGARYIDVWAVDTTINSSDERGKRDIRSLGGELDALQFIRDTDPKLFRREGRNRSHAGWTAQGVKRAMDNQGVDFGAFIDPAVGGVPEGKRAEDGFGHGPLGLRQAELLPVAWQAIRELEERVVALETA